MAQTAFFIIPGFREDATSERYVWFRALLRERGFDPVPVPITWSRRVMSDYFEDFRRCYSARNPQRAYVLGFSYGAVIALATASELCPEKIVLCSLSPAFMEDIPAMKPWIRKLVGKKQLEYCSTLSGRKIARGLRVPATVLYGTKEAKSYPQLQVRSEETVELAKSAKLVVIQDAPHNIGHPLYREAVTRELETL